jgi:hypothetical protein
MGVGEPGSARFPFDTCECLRCWPVSGLGVPLWIMVRGCSPLLASCVLAWSGVVGGARFLSFRCCVIMVCFLLSCVWLCVYMGDACPLLIRSDSCWSVFFFIVFFFFFFFFFFLLQLLYYPTSRSNIRNRAHNLGLMPSTAYNLYYCWYWHAVANTNTCPREARSLPRGGE